MEILYMLRSKHILGVGVLFCFFYCTFGLKVIPIYRLLQNRMEMRIPNSTIYIYNQRPPAFARSSQNATSLYCLNAL